MLTAWRWLSDVLQLVGLTMLVILTMAIIGADGAAPHWQE
jgi:hypothetical protein